MINQSLASGFRRTSAENVSPISTHPLRHQRFLEVETAEHQKNEILLANRALLLKARADLGIQT